MWEMRKICYDNAIRKSRMVRTDMTGAERRERIIETMKHSNVPVSGTALAKKYEVSRQVIVQDIALIRAAGHDIISTHRGYVLETKPAVKRVFKVRHTEEQLEDELQTIVDLGGTIANVKVRHRVYGEMKAPLHIHSRKQVQDFVEDIRSGKSSPLMNITSHYHYHEVEADSEETLDQIESELEKKGYLIR